MAEPEQVVVSGWVMADFSYRNESEHARLGNGRWERRGGIVKYAFGTDPGRTEGD